MTARIQQPEFQANHHAKQFTAVGHIYTVFCHHRPIDVYMDAVAKRKYGRIRTALMHEHVLGQPFLSVSYTSVANVQFLVVACARHGSSCTRRPQPGLSCLECK